MKSMMNVKMLAMVAVIAGLAACSKQESAPAEAPAPSTEAVVVEGASVETPTGSATVESVGVDAIPASGEAPTTETPVAEVESVTETSVEPATEAPAAESEGKKDVEELKKDTTEDK